MLKTTSRAVTVFDPISTTHGVGVLQSRPHVSSPSSALVVKFPVHDREPVKLDTFRLISASKDTSRCSSSFVGGISSRPWSITQPSKRVTFVNPTLNSKGSIVPVTNAVPDDRKGANLPSSENSVSPAKCMPLVYDTFGPNKVSYCLFSLVMYTSDKRVRVMPGISFLTSSLPTSRTCSSATMSSSP